MFSKKKEEKNDEIFSVSDNVEDMFISNTEDDKDVKVEEVVESKDIKTASDDKKTEKPKVEEKIDLNSLSRRDLKEYKRTGKIN